VVICLEVGADLHMAQLMPLPLPISCFIKIQIGFTFLCVCVCLQCFDAVGWAAGRASGL